MFRGFWIFGGDFGVGDKEDGLTYSSCYIYLRGENRLLK